MNITDKQYFFMKTVIKLVWIFIGITCTVIFINGCGNDSPRKITSFNFAEGEQILAADESNGYGYAPSIMKNGDGYYLWYCSGRTGLGDSIVFISSKDGKHWSRPEIALSSFNNLVPDSGNSTKFGFYTHACDPSVVKFMPNKNGLTFYYMFFSTTKKKVSTVNAVARSLTPNGPFEVFIGGNPNNSYNWSYVIDEDHLPYITQYAVNNCPDAQSCYGAGQPSVVNREGVLHMWYTDTTNGTIYIYYTTSIDGVNWSLAIPVNMPVDTYSVDVKYDELSNQYVMFSFTNMHLTDIKIQTLVSNNGVDWINKPTINKNPIELTGDNFYSWVHNPGIAGDSRGYFLEKETLIGFGAPYILGDSGFNNDCNLSSDSTSNCWGHWNVWTFPFHIERN